MWEATFGSQAALRVAEKLVRPGDKVIMMSVLPLQVLVTRRTAVEHAHLTAQDCVDPSRIADAGLAAFATREWRKGPSPMYETILS